jgi:sugar phosphate isomerase/epimerase
LGEYSGKRGIRLAIENNVVSRMNLIDGKNELLLGATADELLEICEAVGSDTLGILFDVGHARVTASALGFDERAFMRQVDAHILGFHLNDNDGLTDSNLLFDEDAWFIPALRETARRAMVIESYALTVQQLKKAITLVQSL